MKKQTSHPNKLPFILVWLIVVCAVSVVSTIVLVGLLNRPTQQPEVFLELTGTNKAVLSLVAQKTEVSKDEEVMFMVNVQTTGEPMQSIMTTLKWNPEDFALIRSEGKLAEPVKFLSYNDTGSSMLVHFIPEETGTINIDRNQKTQVFIVTLKAKKDYPTSTVFLEKASDATSVSFVGSSANGFSASESTVTEVAFTNPSFTEQQVCITKGGTWKADFPNVCADTCSPIPVCTTGVTVGCDCGPNACWDSATSTCKSTAPVCTPNERVCAPGVNGYRTCNEDGMGWSEVAVCAGDLMCDGGICKSITQPVCNFNYKCETDETTTSCPNDCKGDVCKYEQRQCVADKSGYQPCKADGSAWDVKTSCVSGEECTGAGVCTQVTGYCETNEAMRCSASGVPQKCENHVWTNLNACAAGKECTGNGVCADISGYCETNDAMRCSATGRPQQCKNHLWTDQALCASDQTCVNGTCQTPNSDGPALTIKTKLFGVSRADLHVPIQVRIFRAFDPVPVYDQTLDFYSLENGGGVLVNGTVQQGHVLPGIIELPAGNYYQNKIKIQLKGPKHIGLEIDGVPLQLDTDLTRYPLMPGDLPWDSGRQDGKANQDDLNYCANNATSLGNPEAEKLNIADVNYNGSVTAQDCTIIIDAILNREDYAKTYSN